MNITKGNGIKAKENPKKPSLEEHVNVDEESGAASSSQRVRELEAQLASMNEHMKTIKEEVALAVETSLTSDSARRRLTCQGDWYNKKRQRAEHHK